MKKTGYIVAGVVGALAIGVLATAGAFAYRGNPTQFGPNHPYGYGYQNQAQNNSDNQNFFDEMRSYMFGNRYGNNNADPDGDRAPVNQGQGYGPGYGYGGGFGCPMWD